MEVHIKGYHKVKPSKPTWEGVVPLSEWDQTGSITHVPTIYFYKPSQDWLESSKSFMDTLKESLSRTLVHFYPLAGRVRWIGRGRLELVCNTTGVELIEAESTCRLSDFSDFSLRHHQFKTLIPFVDYAKPIDEIPLMLGQLTVFRCGSVCLSTTMSHVIADGSSALHFMTEWSRLARGGPLEAAPYIDYKLLRDRDMTERAQLAPCTGHTEFNPPPLLEGRESDLEERNKPTSLALLPLSKNQVESLKKASNKGPDSPNERPYSRYEVVTAHVWRSACKARGHVNEQQTSLGFSVDVRGRLDPPLPRKYFGNAIIDITASARAGDVMTRPLGYTCVKIREAVKKVNNEYVWSNIEFLKNQPDLSIFQDLHARKNKTDGPFYGNPNLGVISWLTLPIYGMDFGWGKEFYMGPGTHESDGDCLMLPGPENDGSVKVALCLQETHINKFKKYFYDDI